MKFKQAMSYYTFEPSEKGFQKATWLSRKFFHILDTLEYTVEDPLGKNYANLWCPFKWAFGEKLIDTVKENF